MEEVKPVYIAAGGGPQVAAMDNAVIKPVSVKKSRPHVHRLPRRHLDDIVESNSKFTYVEADTLFRCDCGKWFYVDCLGSSLGEWHPVRWYNFMYQSRINRFEEREVSNGASSDLA